MSSQKKQAYLDKLGITHWIPRGSCEVGCRLLLIHDDPASRDRNDSSLMTQLYKGLSLNASNTVSVFYQKDKTDIKPYLNRFDNVIIFGEVLSKAIDSALLEKVSQRHVVTHRLSEGLTAQDKKSLFRQVSQWTF